MADKTIKFSLSQESIKKAIAELKEYKESFDSKCEELCRKLCDAGIEIANSHVGTSNFGRYIHLASNIEPEKAGCKAMFYMEDSQKITSQWKTQDGVKSKDISPSLMLCFGSGLKAENPVGVPGVGTGSYGEHGADPGGWWWMDLNNQWHHSTGIEPKMPMYHAGKEIREKMISIAKEVFQS